MVEWFNHFGRALSTAGRAWARQPFKAQPGPAGNHHQGYVVVEVEYLGGSGTTQVGTAVTIAQPPGSSVAEGAQVAVLYSLTDPRRFAIYTPALGMTAGMVQRS